MNAKLLLKLYIHSKVSLCEVNTFLMNWNNEHTSRIQTPICTMCLTQNSELAFKEFFWKMLINMVNIAKKKIIF